MGHVYNPALQKEHHNFGFSLSNSVRQVYTVYLGCIQTCYVAQSGIKLVVLSLSFPSAGITGAFHHAQLVKVISTSEKTANLSTSGAREDTDFVH